jgi:hypothetical protein
VTEPPITIFSMSDVAYALRVTKQAMSNYRSRHADTVPSPDFVTPDGRLFWKASGLAAWLRWDRERGGNGPVRPSEADRRAIIDDAVRQVMP